MAIPLKTMYNGIIIYIYSYKLLKSFQSAIKSNQLMYLLLHSLFYSVRNPDGSDMTQVRPQVHNPHPCNTGEMQN